MYFHLLWPATTSLVMCLLILPQKLIQSCHPAQSTTAAGSSSSGGEAAATTAAATAAPTTATVATTKPATGTCNSCMETSLVTLTLQDAFSSFLDGQNGHPLAQSVSRPPVAQTTDANGCTVLTTQCATSQITEIRVLTPGAAAPDWGNADSYALVCQNGQWIVGGGTGANGFLPGQCMNKPASDCIVQGYSCVNAVATGRR